MSTGDLSANKFPFEADVSALTENQRDLIAHGWGLSVIGSQVVGELEADSAALAMVDVSFVAANPDIPAENVLSRLDNYNPATPSQQNLLKQAHNLVNYRSFSRLAGLIVCGNAGIGKTHISVGVAKHAVLNGQHASYFNLADNAGSTLRSIEKVVAESDIVLLDDVNNQYGTGADVFRKVITAMHNKGNGKLLVTTNYENPETFAADLTTGPTISAQETTRIRDRVAGALLGLTVEGSSYRSEVQQSQAPWWIEAETSFQRPE